MAQGMPKAQVIEQCGPYGSQEKRTFNFILDKGDVITRVQIESGYVVDALGFEILDTSGNYNTFRSNGTVTAGKLDSVQGRLSAHESKMLNLNGERITRISGFEGDYQGCRHVVQLYIHTDTLPGGYGPFGHKQNCTNVKAFSSPDPSTGPIVGFFGAQGTYLHSLGVYISKENMTDINVTAAFKTDIKNQAYIFMKSEYVKEDYAPGRTDDKILRGPAKVREFPSLKNTVFADGIDCAFGSSNPGEAYIFVRNNVAKWSYPSDTRCDQIIQGPVPISTMFPFLKGTVFENGVDAAFDSSSEYVAYLFKGDKYARINYGRTNPGLLAYHPLIDYWPLFKGTIFENGCFDAAFTSHLEREAYIFKGDSYVRIKFTPGENKDQLIGGVKKIKDYWEGLGSILPRRQPSSNLSTN